MIRIGSKVSVACNGVYRDALVSGHSSDGRLVVRFADGGIATVRKNRIKRRTRPRSSTSRAEAALRSKVQAVFREFAETVQRPPTARELRCWLPGTWAGPLAKKMGLEFAQNQG